MGDPAKEIRKECIKRKTKTFVNHEINEIFELRLSHILKSKCLKNEHLNSKGI